MSLRIDVDQPIVDRVVTIIGDEPGSPLRRSPGFYIGLNEEGRTRLPRSARYYPFPPIEAEESPLIQAVPE